jgi:paraquat-inducible protein B
MSRKANKTAVGAFVAGAVILFIMGLSIFGSGFLFKRADKYVLFFEGSVKGLSAGAPVVFRGVKIGNVESVNLLYDKQTTNVNIMVNIEVELSRVKGVQKHVGHPNYEQLIKKGLRARLEVLSFVTGQLIVSFDFYPGTPVKFLDVKSEYTQIPTIPMAPSFVESIETLPVKEIAADVKGACAGINKLVNSEAFCRLDETFYETTQAARAMRLFLEYLEQHPEALLKGKTKGEE